MSGIEIIRTERRRRYSDAEKAALLTEVERSGCTVAKVARRAMAYRSMNVRTPWPTVKKQVIGKAT